MANSILYSEINTLCALILLLLCIKVKRSMFLQEQRYLFLKVAVSNVIFLLLDSIWIFMDNNVLQVTILMNWMINAAYYVLSAYLGYFWLCYSETIQNSRLVRDKRYHGLILIPVVVLSILVPVSAKTNWLFYVDSANVYHRGPLYPIQLICAYGYVVFTAVKAFLLSFKTDDYRRKKELQTLATFVLPTLVAGTLQVSFPGYPIICMGNTVGILYIYLTLQEQLISLDALTKLNNRNQLFQYLSTKLAHPREDKVLYLLIMDIDYFKSINDSFGHVEGDRALRLVAGCLMKACSNRSYFISRYGGDEFVAICELDPGETVTPFCDHIHDNLRKVDTKYPLSLSIGCARYTPDIKNQQDFVDRADKELYKIKKSRPAR